MEVTTKFLVVLNSLGNEMFTDLEAVD